MREGDVVMDDQLNEQFRFKRWALSVAAVWYLQLVLSIPLSMILFYGYFPDFPRWLELAGGAWTVAHVSFAFTALFFDLRAERKGASPSLVARAPFVFVLFSLVFALSRAFETLFVSLPQACALGCPDLHPAGDARALRHSELIPWDAFLRFVLAIVPFIGALVTSRQVKPTIDSKFMGHLILWYFGWLLGLIGLVYWSEPYFR